MQKLSPNQKHVQSQMTMGCKAAWRGSCLTLWQSSLIIPIEAPFKDSKEAMNIFMNQNKGKGPPGGRCSPGTGYSPFPDCKQIASKNNKTNQLELMQLTQYQFSNLFHN